MGDLRFTWDPGKAAANLRKHGMALEDASTVFRNPLAQILSDPTHSDREQRSLILGHSAWGRVLLVVFTETERIRIISARDASARERRAYEEHSSGTQRYQGRGHACGVPAGLVQGEAKSLCRSAKGHCGRRLGSGRGGSVPDIGVGEHPPAQRHCRSASSQTQVDASAQGPASSEARANNALNPTRSSTDLGRRGGGKRA